MPRKTKAQIALLLADLHAAKNDKRKAEIRVDDLEAEVTAIANLKEGQYGEWTYALGTPREILDQQGAKEALRAKGLPIPTKFTKASIVVKPVVK
jgi:hypothetical protein